MATCVRLFSDTRSSLRLGRCRGSWQLPSAAGGKEPIAWANPETRLLVLPFFLSTEIGVPQPRSEGMLWMRHWRSPQRRRLLAGVIHPSGSGFVRPAKKPRFSADSLLGREV
eukprot:2706265-Rhodomonas_salina.1